MRRPRRRQQQLFPPSSPPHRRGNYKLIPSATFYPVDGDRCFSPVKAKSPPSHYSGFVSFIQWLGGKYLLCKVDCLPLLKLLHSSANPTCRHSHQPLFRPHGLVRTVAAVTVPSDLQNRGKVDPHRRRDRPDRWWSLGGPGSFSAPAHLCPHSAPLAFRGSGGVSERLLRLGNTSARFIWAIRRRRGAEAAGCTNGPGARRPALQRQAAVNRSF